MLKKELSIKIDYLSIVFDTIKVDELIRKVLGLPLEYFLIQKDKDTSCVSLPYPLILHSNLMLLDLDPE